MAQLTDALPTSDIPTKPAEQISRENTEMSSRVGELKLTKFFTAVIPEDTGHSLKDPFNGLVRVFQRDVRSADTALGESFSALQNLPGSNELGSKIFLGQANIYSLRASEEIAAVNDLLRTITLLDKNNPGLLVPSRANVNDGTAS